jgi:hypothetical protein
MAIGHSAGSQDDIAKKIARTISLNSRRPGFSQPDQALPYDHCEDKPDCAKNDVQHRQTLTDGRGVLAGSHRGKKAALGY